MSASAVATAARSSPASDQDARRSITPTVSTWPRDLQASAAAAEIHLDSMFQVCPDSEVWVKPGAIKNECSCSLLQPLLDH